MIDDDDPMTTLSAPMRSVLQAQLALGWKPTESLDVGAVRQRPTLTAAAAAVLAGEGRKAPDRGILVEDAQIGAGSSAMRVRLYRPRDPGHAAPLALYLHGGMWVDGSLEEFESSATSLALRLNAIVAAPEYRLAPEHPYPAAHEDALAAHRWLHAEAARLGADAQRLAVVGEAAGGNLAANLVIAARDSTLPTPQAMALICPMIWTDTGSYSYNRTEQCRPLNKAAMRWYLQQAIDAKHRDDNRVNLGNFDLRGLPPTAIVTADVDPLMFEGKLFAHKLESSDVPTQFLNVEGVVHGFFGLDAVLPEATFAQDFIARQLREALKL
jgi:acetyl esterase